MVRYCSVLMFCSNLPPSQGGKYVGFGNCAPVEKNEDDYLNNALSSLSSVSLNYKICF